MFRHARSVERDCHANYRDTALIDAGHPRLQGRSFNRALNLVLPNSGNSVATAAFWFHLLRSAGRHGQVVQLLGQHLRNDKEIL
jgi:hypothetical protein